MSLTTYTFKDVFFSKKHRIVVKDNQDKEVGAIIRTYDRNSSKHSEIRL